MKFSQLPNRDNIIAVIPARGGSKGIPNKNITKLLGKPLIAYSIEIALSSSLIDRVIVTTEDKKIVKQMHLFGEMAGIAFQIKDDLFDYSHNPKIGKPTGIDIREQKMTLPLIYTLSISDRVQKKKIINTIKNHNNDSKKVTELIALVKESGGLDYAITKMNESHQRALTILDKFEDCEAKTALKKMIDFVIHRKQ